jgi:hypothetical protein
MLAHKCGQLTKENGEFARAASHFYYYLIFFLYLFEILSTYIADKVTFKSTQLVSVKTKNFSKISLLDDMFIDRIIRCKHIVKAETISKILN